MSKMIDVLESILIGAIPLGIAVGLVLFSLYTKYGWILLSIILFVSVSFFLGDIWKDMIKNRED